MFPKLSKVMNRNTTMFLTGGAAGLGPDHWKKKSDPLSAQGITGDAELMEQLYPKFSQGYENFRAEALRKGPSDFLNMSLAQRALQGQDRREKGLQQVGAQTAASQDALAAAGGLSSGARERLQENAQNNVMNMTQGIAREDALADLGLRVQDEQNRVGKLGALSDMERTRMMDWVGAKQREMDRRAEIMAAERSAQAQENSGKK